MGVNNNTGGTITRALDPTLYSGQETFDKERDSVFKKSWRLVGHENMIPTAGNFIADEVAGASIIILRDQSGAINGFHNVCRHRAGPLVDAPSGHCDQVLTCKYHGWQYTLDGRLRSARDFGAAPGFDPREFNLHAVNIAQWRGFIFASLSNDTPSLDELMQPVKDGWPIDEIQPFAVRRSHVIECNWKAYVENYLEGYHVPDVHPTLDAEIDSSAYRVDMVGSVAVHTAPSKMPDAVYSGYWAWVWPWLGVNVYQHGVMMERISPIAPNQTQLDYLYFFDPDKREELDAMMALSQTVTNEDKTICEQVQKNLSAGIYQAGPLSPRHETAVAWFQNTLRNQVGYKG